MQLENGKFYLHSSGVDITFGDGVNYGGILLRSVIKMYDGTDDKSGFFKEQFDGPQIVATELFSNLHYLNDNEPNIISLIDIEGRNQDSCFSRGRLLIKTKRVGLMPKEQDKEDFYMHLPIRYIVVLHNFSAFKQNKKVVDKNREISLGCCTCPKRHFIAKGLSFTLTETGVVHGGFW